jgi:hypothetical protein
VGTVVGIFPLKATPQNGNAVIANPVATNTNLQGCFSLQTVGGIFDAFYVQGSQTTPMALLKATLPLSGTFSFSSLLPASSSVSASFPPAGSLNMAGETFLNLSPATITGEPVVEGGGLQGGQMFTASGTYTPPLNATWVVATLLAGGGGGGGGASGGTNGGGGGGAGELLQCLMLPSNGPVSVIIGSGGIGGGAITDGTQGNDSTVSQQGATTECDAGGGMFGTAGTGSGVGTGGVGGNSGSEIVGAAVQMFDQAGVAGKNGASSIGGNGGGLGFLGGTGGAPHGQTGSVGKNGVVLMRSF